MAFGEKIRTWRRDGFVLELWDTHQPTGRGYLGDSYLAYRFCDRGRVIFQGSGFVPPLSVPIDSDACVAACLFWFTLQPGDVEEEFFNGYSRAQREWADSGRAEQLGWLVQEMESEEAP
jgi:hypothetical protein